jgi:hypothetical protein
MGSVIHDVAPAETTEHPPTVADGINDALSAWARTFATATTPGTPGHTPQPRRPYPPPLTGGPG